MDISSFKYSGHHNHTDKGSNGRMLDCIIRSETLVDEAIKLGWCGVSCTDHESLAAHMTVLERYQALKSLKAKYDKYLADGDEEGLANDKDVQSEIKLLEIMPSDFQLGLGNEIYLIDDIEETRSRDDLGYWHFILIAKDRIGYDQIKKISSESAWKNWYKTGRMARVPTLKTELEEIIGDDKGHIIASTACLGSELDHYILDYVKTRNDSHKEKINDFIKWCISVFGKDNFFLEIQPCLDKPADNLYDMHPQIIVDRFMFKLAKAYDLRVNLTTDSHYTRPEMKAIHEAFLNSDNDENASARETAGFYDATYMFSKEELYKALSNYLTDEQIEKAFVDTEYERSLIQDFDLHHRTVVPFDKNIPEFELRHLFEPYYEKYEFIKKFAYSDDLQDRYLLFLIENGFFDELKENCDSVYPKYSTTEYTEDGTPVQIGTIEVPLETKIARINEELETFWGVSERLGQKISSYYVLVRQFIQNVLWKKSYVGVGRGSVNGSYVCYIIQIIQINPLHYELPFWRHLHVSRPELPDIDLDTEAGQRQNIIQGLKDYLGQKNVINTLTFRTMTSKSAALSACFDENTMVNTDSGLKKISEIKSGDIVYTDNGKEMVEYPTRRKFTGDMYTIKSAAMNKFVCTENHKFLVLCSKRKAESFGPVCNYCPCYLTDSEGKIIEEFVSGAAAARYASINYGVSYHSILKYFSSGGYSIKYKDKVERIKKNEIRWLRADELQKEDKLLSFVDEDIIDTKEIYFSRDQQNKFLIKNFRYIPEHIKLSKEFFELIGIYYAEGSIAHKEHGIDFTISEDEEDFMRRIIYLVKFVFGDVGIYVNNKKESKAVTIRVNSTAIGRLFNFYFPGKAFTKRVPDFILKAHPDWQACFLKGYFCGDGTARIKNESYECKFTTISYNLASSTWMMLARNGINAGFNYESRREYKNRYPTYNIYCWGGAAKIFYDAKYRDINKDFSITTAYNGSSNRNITYNGKTYMPVNIHSIEKVPVVNKDVYCLHVPSNRFILNNVIVHNCRGMGIDNDRASAISALIPFERGANWTFKDCFEGNEEKGRKPVTEFINEVKNFPGLKDVMLAIEGMVCGYGIHASSVYCFTNGYLELNGRMKAPNGTDITIWNMADSD